MNPEHAARKPPKIVPKPWGSEIWWAVEDEYAGKILEVSAGHSLSLQKHLVKKESMYVLRGSVRFHLNGHEFEMGPGDCITVLPGDVHRLAAITDSAILEVSTPQLDDLVRLEDRYGRNSNSA